MNFGSMARKRPNKGKPNKTTTGIITDIDLEGTKMTLKLGTNAKRTNRPIFTGTQVAGLPSWEDFQAHGKGGVEFKGGSRHDLRIRLPLTGVKNPQIGKGGFRSQKTPISPHPRKGRPESKNPHFPCGALYRNGDFLTRDALFWGGGKWGFFDSETLFS